MNALGANMRMCSVGVTRFVSPAPSGICQKLTNWGILLHEVGHVLAGQRASEKRANETILKASGIRVRYRDSHYGSRLEWIRTKDKADAEEFLGLK